MKTRKAKRAKTPRLRVVRGGREATAGAGHVTGSGGDIVCHVGVPVQVTRLDGLELVEFEFLPDAA